MKLEKNQKTEIIDNSNILSNVKNTLKSEFIGLDSIIDELMRLVEPWYLFPDFQFRPLVINMFGMTSVGKTSLIIRLFELLDINNIVRFDTGEWTGENTGDLSYKISTKVKKINKNLAPIFIFDEFQLGRTLDDTGTEIDRPQLRIIWDLLDSGKFTVLEEKWEVGEVSKLYNKIEFLVKDKGVKSKNGKITKSKNEWNNIFLNLVEEESYTEFENKLIENYSKEALIPVDEINTMYTLCEDKFFSEIELCNYLMKLDELQTLEFLEKIVENSETPKEYDFSNSIIFIIGNLDDVYVDSDQMTPDIDADYLYESTNKITITDIKNGLSRLYRPEQISRLGNNFLIYKSFNVQNYKDIITLELNKLIIKIQNKFDIKLEFDTSINDIVYKEGVFPTQGVRPIFSTINNLIESHISGIITDSIKNGFDIENIIWSFIEDYFIIKLIEENKEEKIKTIKPNLKLESLRKSKCDDIQALVALHEAGHVIAALYSVNICPKIAMSKTANDNGGFTITELPDWDTKELLEKQLILCVGGYCAEKLIFGQDNLTTGASTDIAKSTNIALAMVKEFGMVLNIPALYSAPDFRISSELICIDSDQMDKESENIIVEAVEKCMILLSENKKLLLMLAEYLLHNSEITENTIKEFVVKYGSYIPEYKTKDNYYNFKNILETEIKKLK